MIRTVTINLILPTCAICQRWAPMDDIYKEPKAYCNVAPKGWINIVSNIICDGCMDELRTRFMEEQNPKGTFPPPKSLEGIAKQKPRFEKKEEHWLTRNGTRVLVKMPLPAVGSIYDGSPIGMGEKPTLIRWDKNYNCVEVSWLQKEEFNSYKLGPYDLVERLEDSVKKEQG